MLQIESLEGRRLLSVAAPIVHAALRGHALFVVGTPGDDVIDVGLVPAAGGDVAHIAVYGTNGVTPSAFSFPAARVRRVIVMAGAGNDTVDTTNASTSFAVNLPAGAVALNVPVVIAGGAGNDVLFGSSQNDTINGGPGNDAISGGAGDDLLLGGPGADGINGGAGDDRIVGGPGADDFLTSDFPTELIHPDRLDSIFQQATQGLLPVSGRAAVLLGTSTPATLDLTNNELITTDQQYLVAIDSGKVYTAAPGGASDSGGGATTYYSASDGSGIHYTLKGDQNLDGQVDVGDLGALAASYGITGGMSWANSGFNSSGTVDVGDLGALATNYAWQLAGH